MRSSLLQVLSSLSALTGGQKHLHTDHKQYAHEVDGDFLGFLYYSAPGIDK
ncbi:MAG: hypothetical protein IKK83_04215 [Clostridia bacterium]|nr:hypothetical protein [Clostridia bacterium]